jgi:hypothetical protein
VGFDGQSGPAKDQIRANPDPPADLQLIWEPRFGDIAASGDLGYLTGPRSQRPEIARQRTAAPFHLRVDLGNGSAIDRSR